MYKNIIKILENLARENGAYSQEIGKAIHLVKFCEKNGITSNDKTKWLPEASEQFGYFIIQECNEMGDIISTIWYFAYKIPTRIEKSIGVLHFYCWESLDITRAIIRSTIGSDYLPRTFIIPETIIKILSRMIIELHFLYNFCSL